MVDNFSLWLLLKDCDPQKTQKKELPRNAREAM